VLTCEHGFFDAFLELPGVGYEVVDGLGEHDLMRQIGVSANLLHGFGRFMALGRMALS
jgi:hypothetical protein